jgi:hypothetical protein
VVRASIPLGPGRLASTPFTSAHANGRDEPITNTAPGVDERNSAAVAGGDTPLTFTELLPALNGFVPSYSLTESNSVKWAAQPVKRTNINRGNVMVRRIA